MRPRPTRHLARSGRNTRRLRRGREAARSAPAARRCRNAGCATEIVRNWSAALDRNDNEGAAWLFADGARVVQDSEVILQNHADAVRWNSLLPCGGKILTLSQQGASQILAVFRLEERPGHR